ncbi:MAG: biopolymer transporter ExbD [Acidobacteriota bacterium]
MRSARTTSLQSEINVTPLVDVCLVLLIIFMVVVPAMVSGTVPVQLPQTRTAEAVESAHVLPITVKEDGTVYVDAQVLRGEQVPNELRRLHQQAPRRPVAVRGDKRVAYGRVVTVLDACRSAGYEHLGLISDRAPSWK